jgi:hypothetical protein
MHQQAPSSSASPTASPSTRAPAPTWPPSACSRLVSAAPAARAKGAAPVGGLPAGKAPAAPPRAASGKSPSTPASVLRGLPPRALPGLSDGPGAPPGRPSAPPLSCSRSFQDAAPAAGDGTGVAAPGPAAARAAGLSDASDDAVLPPFCSPRAGKCSLRAPTVPPLACTGPAPARRDAATADQEDGPAPPDAAAPVAPLPFAGALLLLNDCRGGDCARPAFATNPFVPCGPLLHAAGVLSGVTWTSCATAAIARAAQLPATPPASVHETIPCSPAARAACAAAPPAPPCAASSAPSAVACSGAVA